MKNHILHYGKLNYCLGRNCDWLERNAEKVINFSYKTNKRFGHSVVLLTPPECPGDLFINTIENKYNSSDDTICLRLNSDSFLSLSDITEEKIHAELFNNIVRNQAKRLFFIVNYLGLTDTNILRLFLDTLDSVFRNYDFGDTKSDCCILVVCSSRISILALEYKDYPNRSLLMLMPEISNEAAGLFINLILNNIDRYITPDAREQLIEITAGNCSLIHSILDIFLDREPLSLDSNVAGEFRAEKKVDKEKLRWAIDRFLEQYANQYIPLRRAIQAIESNSFALLTLLNIMENRPARSAIDSYDYMVPWYAGAVIVLESDGSQVYSIRNGIYYKYFITHFHTEKVVDILLSSGMWIEAIKYLKPIVQVSRYAAGGTTSKSSFLI